MSLPKQERRQREDGGGETLVLRDLDDLGRRDNGGLILRLEGGWNGESMVLANESSRITWTPAEDGTVRQLWEQTEDGGETWKVVFDGKYVRRADGE